MMRLPLRHDAPLAASAKKTPGPKASRTCGAEAAAAAEAPLVENASGEEQHRPPAGRASAVGGVTVSFVGNPAPRNACSAHPTNWPCVAKHVCGPIFRRAAPAGRA